MKSRTTGAECGLRTYAENCGLVRCNYVQPNYPELPDSCPGNTDAASLYDERLTATERIKVYWGTRIRT